MQMQANADELLGVAEALLASKMEAALAPAPTATVKTEPTINKIESDSE
jgi:hypothetical protein